MKNSAAVRQVLSAAAVVLSLAFVGVEIRQNTAAQRAQTRQELAAGSREFMLTLASNPDVARAYGTIYIGAAVGAEDSLSALDSLRADMMMWSGMRNAENVYLQFREGVVDSTVLRTYGFVAGMYRRPAFMQYWDEIKPSFDSSFVRAFEQANGYR